MTLVSRALVQLATWPDLVAAEPSCGVGRALRSAHTEIAHPHSDRDVDLHLTTPTIGRFQDHLAAAAAVRLVPGSPWVTLHLDGAADIDLLMTLVSLALQVHQAWPDPDDVPQADCNDHRSAARPHENLSEG